MDGVGQGIGLVEDDTDVLAVRMSDGIAVVLDVAGRHGVDRVVTAHNAVLAGPPVGASLLVEDVAGDDELVCRSKSASRLHILN